MASIFRNPIRRTNPSTGKQENAVDAKGKPLFHPNWRTVIVDHEGKRKTFTLGPDKIKAQQQANIIEAREREIKNGTRVEPASEAQAEARLFDEVLQEYFAWGMVRGGKRNMPWSEKFAVKKQRNLAFWKTCLSLETLNDFYGILPRVESQCHKMLKARKTGKTVWNTVMDLTAFIKWCKKRRYLNEDPLSELGKFDTTPQSIRRAMTPEELQLLLEHCAVHRRLLYEVAFCSGLRENELRRLEPEWPL